MSSHELVIKLDTENKGQKFLIIWYVYTMACKYLWLYNIYWAGLLIKAKNDKKQIRHIQSKTYTKRNYFKNKYFKNVIFLPFLIFRWGTHLYMSLFSSIYPSIHLLRTIS